MKVELTYHGLQRVNERIPGDAQWLLLGVGEAVREHRVTRKPPSWVGSQDLKRGENLRWTRLTHESAGQVVALLDMQPMKARIVTVIARNDALGPSSGTRKFERRTAGVRL